MITRISLNLSDFDVEGSNCDRASSRFLGNEQRAQKVLEFMLSHFLEAKINISGGFMDKWWRCPMLSYKLLL